MPSTTQPRRGFLLLLVFVFTFISFTLVYHFHHNNNTPIRIRDSLNNIPVDRIDVSEQTLRGDVIASKLGNETLKYVGCGSTMLPSRLTTAHPGRTERNSDEQHGNSFTRPWHGSRTNPHRMRVTRYNRIHISSPGCTLGRVVAHVRCSLIFDRGLTGRLLLAAVNAPVTSNRSFEDTHRRSPHDRRRRHGRVMFITKSTGRYGSSYLTVRKSATFTTADAPMMRSPSLHPRNRR